MNLGPLFTEGVGSRPDVDGQCPRFVHLDYPVRGSAYAKAIEGLPRGASAAIVIRLERAACPGRAMDFVMLPFRVARARRAIATGPAALVGAYAMFPSIDEP